MATITGKRFQMTDGAETPINLFPYTVSEAVYGLNNTISNAISSALSAISLSTYAGTSAIGSSAQPVYYNGSALVACDLSATYAPYNSAGYLPLLGGTISNKNVFSLYINNSTSGAASVGIRFQLEDVLVGSLYATSDGLYYNSSKVWNSGNSNLSSVPWACSTLRTIDITCQRTLTNTDWNAINITNGGSWGGAGGKIACINVTDGAGTVGRFGVGYSNGTGGFFAVGNFYSNDYGATGYIMTVNRGGVSVTGDILSTGDQIISSDLTLKMNLQDVTYSVSDIAKCRAVTFDWKDGHGHSAGSIAQDWKPLIPELVHGEEGGMTLAYGQIALVNSILEAREIERLKERVAELEQQLKMRS